MDTARVRNAPCTLGQSVLGHTLHSRSHTRSSSNRFVINTFNKNVAIDKPQELCAPNRSIHKLLCSLFAAVKREQNILERLRGTMSF